MVCEVKRKMANVTITDCVRNQCPMLKKCTAHITGGSWPHNKGTDPCVVSRSEGDSAKILAKIREGIAEEDKMQREICTRGYSQRFAERGDELWQTHTMFTTA